MPGTSMTASSMMMMMVDSMNQPLRDKVALAWNPRRKVRKVRMPDIELSGPKTIMKVRMDRRFQARGRPGCPWPMLPGQQADSAGAGDMRLAGRLLRREGQHPRRTP